MEFEIRKGVSDTSQLYCKYDEKGLKLKRIKRILDKVIAIKSNLF